MLSFEFRLPLACDMCLQFLGILSNISNIHRPVIGAFVTVRKGWRWTQWTLIFFAIFAFILTTFARETHQNTILTRRAKHRKLPLPPSPFPSRSAKIRFLITVTLIRPLHMLITEPIVAFLS